MGKVFKWKEWIFPSSFIRVLDYCWLLSVDRQICDLAESTIGICTFIWCCRNQCEFSIYVNNTVRDKIKCKVSWNRDVTKRDGRERVAMLCLKSWGFSFVYFRSENYLGTSSLNELSNFSNVRLPIKPKKCNEFPRCACKWYGIK